jgi:hypothetical protein
MRRLRHAWIARDGSTARIWIAMLLLGFTCWLLAWRHPASEARQDCARRYAAATTLADTLRIDRQSSGAGTRPGAWNCGMLRRAS